VTRKDFSVAGDQPFVFYVKMRVVQVVANIARSNGHLDFSARQLHDSTLQVDGAGRTPQRSRGRWWLSPAGQSARRPFASAGAAIMRDRITSKQLPQDE